MIGKMTLFTTVLAALFFAQIASADAFAEIGDAGELPGTSQQATASPLTEITGTVSGGSDMFELLITGIEPFSAFTADPPVSPGLFIAGIDAQLFLFDALGFGVWSNDDCDSPGSTAACLMGTPPLRITCRHVLSGHIGF